MNTDEWSTIVMVICVVGLVVIGVLMMYGVTSLKIQYDETARLIINSCIEGG